MLDEDDYELLQDNVGFRRPLKVLSDHCICMLSYLNFA